MSMNRVVVLMLLVFVLEGALMPWLIPAGYGDRLIPHFVFVLMMYAALYGSRYQALLLGLGFGLLQDIVFYGHFIGAHTFLMGLIGYFTGYLFSSRKVTLMMAVAIVGLAYLVYDSTLLFIYKVFKISNADYAWALLHHILPSLFLQLMFMLICYIPVRKMFQSLQKKQTETEED